MLKIPSFAFFDLDGTLLDNSEIVIDAYEDGLRKYGFSVMSRSYIGKLAGKSTFNTARELGVPEDDLHLIDKHFWEYFRGFAASDQLPIIFDDVENLLKLMKAKNIRMGVITSNEAGIANKLLEKVNLLHYFEEVVGAEDVENKKPSTEPVVTILSRLGEEFNPAVDNRDNIWIIGDTESDVGCANNSGSLSIAIPQHHTYETVISADADMLVGSISDLYNYLLDEWK